MPQDQVQHRGDGEEHVRADQDPGPAMGEHSTPGEGWTRVHP